MSLPSSVLSTLCWGRSTANRFYFFRRFLVVIPLSEVEWGICFTAVALNPEATINERLHTELWTSWASLLRSYAAAHGLNAPQHAVVEVSAEEITLRVGSRWLRFTQYEMQHSDEAAVPFALQEDGSVSINHAAEEEMDLAAERLAREMMHPPQ